jgi:Flp pilus assembly protein TadG
MRGPVVVAQQLPQTSHRRRRGYLDRGAVAVEMAFVLPVLLFLLMGMIDFGRAYNAQIQLSQAAREGVRLASLNATANTADANYGDTAISTRVTSAAGGLPTFAVSCAAPTSTSSSVCITYCPVPATTTSSATVVATTQFTWITGISAMSKFFGSAFSGPTTLQSTGVMRCAG